MVSKKQSLFRRINNFLHLWLGLISGLVVCVVCLTAAIWTFRYEITFYFEKGNRIEPQEKAYTIPSILKNNAEAYLAKQGKSLGKINSIFYRAADKSVLLTYVDTVSKEQKYFYLNPYTGEVILHREQQSSVQDFILFLRAGHRFFWLPREIGSTFVGTNCLIFLVLLITGLVWWYPKKWNQSTRDKSFKIKWSAKWKRLNIDLHNVLGFYASFFAIILTITGLFYSFSWFRAGYFYTISAGKTLEMPNNSLSVDTLTTRPLVEHIEDILFQKHYPVYQKDAYEALYIFYPYTEGGAYTIQLRKHEDTQYHALSYKYDPRTLKLLEGPVDKSKLNFGEKVFQANFDIHVGSIGGIWTKIIASLTSLIGASLPITGFIIWFNRKWGKKKRKI